MQGASLLHEGPGDVLGQQVGDVEGIMWFSSRSGGKVVGLVWLSQDSLNRFDSRRDPSLLLMKAFLILMEKLKAVSSIK